MKQRIYRIGYERVNKQELLDRLQLTDCYLYEYRNLNTTAAESAGEIPPEDEQHCILVRFQQRPSEWITFTGTYEILLREPIPWIDSPLEYHLHGVELVPGNVRRQKAPQARIPARTKLQIAAIRQDTVFVTVPGHPSRKYEMSLSYARFAKDFPTELELRLQIYAFPPQPDILVDWLLAEGRKTGFLVNSSGDRIERTAFQVWNDMREEYGISVSAAILAIKQALIVLDRAGMTNDFPYPGQGAVDLSLTSDAEREAFYSYHAVRAAIAAVSSLLTTDPKDKLQDYMLLDIMLEQQVKRKRA